MSIASRFFDVVEFVQALWELPRRLRAAPFPYPPLQKPDDTQPIPLSYRDVEHIQGQIRHATEQRPEMRPPPRKSSRYE